VGTGGMSGDNRIGWGTGFQGGQAAGALGIQHAFNSHANIAIGGSFSSGESSVGVGGGFSW